MKRIMQMTLLFALSAAIYGGDALAETGTVVNDLWQLSQQHGQQFHNRYKAMERADRSGQRRIEIAFLQLQSARTANAKTYHRLDYVEQRALHIKTMAQEMIGLLRDNDRYLEASEKAHKNFSLFLDSDQLVGMRNLVNMVMAAEQKRQSESADLVKDASSRLLTLSLAYLVTPPQVMDASQLRSAKDCRDDLMRCLQKFRKEIDYLDRQLQTI